MVDAPIFFVYMYRYMIKLISPTQFILNWQLLGRRWQKQHLLSEVCLHFSPHDKDQTLFIDFFTFHLANITHFPMTQLRITTPFSLTLLLSIYQILQISKLPTIHRPSTLIDITTLHISNITDFPMTHHTQTKHFCWHYYSPYIKYYRFPN